jgi:hypothetical protein
MLNLIQSDFIYKKNCIQNLNLDLILNRLLKFFIIYIVGVFYRCRRVLLTLKYKKFYRYLIFVVFIIMYITLYFSLILNIIYLDLLNLIYKTILVLEDESSIKSIEDILIFYIDDGIVYKLSYSIERIIYR